MRVFCGIFFPQACGFFFRKSPGLRWLLRVFCGIFSRRPAGFFSRRKRGLRDLALPQCGCSAGPLRVAGALPRPPPCWSPPVTKCAPPHCDVDYSNTLEYILGLGVLSIGEPKGGEGPREVVGGGGGGGGRKRGGCLVAAAGGRDGHRPFTACGCSPRP